jgi:formylglycine-generating enzyme required for sulfatase activity
MFVTALFKPAVAWPNGAGGNQRGDGSAMAAVTGKRRIWPVFAVFAALSALAACFAGQAASGGTARPDTPATVPIPAGPFIAGSDRAEREAAYRLDEAAYGHGRTREWGWYDDERRRGPVELGFYFITRATITNAQYASFVAATGHKAPDVDRATWKGYRLIHPFERTRKFAWQRGRPPKGRGDHPVVLVSHADARAYASWLSRLTGRRWRLPSELEWEKAARGTDGRRFPWGDAYDAKLLNSHDLGPFETTKVGSFRAGASPFGLWDAAGQVFEWTATSEGQAGGQSRYVVKGGSWDDKGCGICRPAARHTRPERLKHILIGFRLVREGQ